MKTIKIRDDVYEKLVEIKGKKSFSDVIDELIEESKKARNKKKNKNLEKYFGILSKEEAEELWKEIEEARRKFDEGVSRYVSDD